MSAPTPRERWLLGATIASGLLVALSHTGGPIACATTVQQVETRPVRLLLHPGQQPEIVLTRSGAPTGNAYFARIKRGSLLELHRRPGAPGEQESEGALAGFDPIQRSILITPDGETIEAVPYDQLQTLTVLGESPTGAHVGNGALIGGLSGAAVGGLIGAGIGGRDYGALCAVIVGVPAGAVGAGLGAGVGAAASPGRARTRYPLGPGGWQIAPPPFQPGLSPNTGTNAGAL